MKETIRPIRFSPPSKSFVRASALESGITFLPRRSRPLHFNGCEEGSSYGIYHSIQNTGARALWSTNEGAEPATDGTKLPFPGIAGCRDVGVAERGAYCRDQINFARTAGSRGTNVKVFVTGMGVFSSLGNDVDTFFDGLKLGLSGVRRMPEWRQYKGLHSYLAAPAPDFDIMKIPRTVRRSMSRMSEMASLATFQALAQADLQPGPTFNSPRVLLILGSTSGSPTTLELYFRKLIERNGPEGQLSTSFFKVMNHSVAANVAAAINFNGALISPSSACSTSTQAVIMGWELIKAGLYDLVIAGGADELHYMSAAIFDIVQAASRGYNDTPDAAPRPFDKNRDGLVVSEGAGVLILESARSVAHRRARPVAEILGGAYLCDGSHMSQSSAATMMNVMHEALRRADLTPAQVDYVNAHATATIHGDIEEARAISGVFGDKIRTSGLKGHLGHSLAACGALEAIAAIKMIEEGILIPTRNLNDIAEECRGVHHLQENTYGTIKTILSNNFAFGGMNTCLLVSGPP